MKLDRATVRMAPVANLPAGAWVCGGLGAAASCRARQSPRPTAGTVTHDAGVVPKPGPEGAMQRLLVCAAHARLLRSAAAGPGQGCRRQAAAKAVVKTQAHGVVQHLQDASPWQPRQTACRANRGSLADSRGEAWRARAALASFPALHPAVPAPDSPPPACPPLPVLPLTQPPTTPRALCPSTVHCSCLGGEPPRRGGRWRQTSRR